MSAWIKTENVIDGLSDSGWFAESSFAGSSMYAQWWLPTPASHAIFALQNLEPVPLDLTTTIHIGGQLISGNNIHIEGKSAVRVDLTELLPSPLAPSEIGAISFYASDPTAHLSGRVLIADAGLGFSASAELKNEDLGMEMGVPAVTSGAPAPGLGYPPGTEFSTNIVLTNLGGDPLTVSPFLYGSDSNGSDVSWQAPDLTLAPFEVRMVNLESDLLVGSPIVGNMVAIELSQIGELPRLLADAVIFSQDMRHSALCAFEDLGLASTAKFAVSFDLSEPRDTMLVVRNTWTKAIDYSFIIGFLRADSSIGSYIAEPTGLAGKAMQAIDLKTLRNQQVPDMNGVTIPLDVTLGNVMVFASEPALMVADPTFDPVAGTMFLCLNICNPFRERHISPFCDYEDFWPILPIPEGFFLVRYGYRFSHPSGLPPFGSVCYYAPCEPSATCSKSQAIEILGPGTPCNAGIRNTFTRYRVLLFRFCVRLSHEHLPINPCPG